MNFAWLCCYKWILNNARNGRLNQFLVVLDDQMTANFEHWNYSVSSSQNYNF